MSESDTMFNERDRRCAAVQLMLSTDPTYDNRTVASTLKMQIRTVRRLRAQLNALDDTSDGYGYGLWCGFKWGPHHATSHLRSRLESQHQSVAGCGEECGDPLVQSGGRWQTLGCGSRTRPHKSNETQAWLQKEFYDFVPFSHCPLLPRPEPARLLRLVIRREHHQHDLPQHQSQPDRRHPPSIRRAPAGVCWKDMLPVPDPYRGGNWDWRRLHWIDISSTT